jgi:hypothetical protein
MMKLPEARFRTMDIRQRFDYERHVRRIPLGYKM